MKADECFDYDTELVIVFGRRCHDVPDKDALEVVAGRKGAVTVIDRLRRHHHRDAFEDHERCRGRQTAAANRDVEAETHDVDAVDDDRDV
ncbi:fumarylacetoacetate hydrolase family protein [Novosphingobium sp. 9U]|uniref:fumarylacetoacetate hydrolase family protein n=1 Tax=Novosphingobium sp. 9U TaxID=2653158 RepID=UPI001359ABC1|nr:fumarylacetoacetate hydrolase family protein [Novosphingobium sp. 9U]